MFYCICCFKLTSFYAFMYGSALFFFNSSIVFQRVNCQIVIRTLLMDFGLCSCLQCHAQLHFKLPQKEETHAGLNSDSVGPKGSFMFLKNDKLCSRVKKVA